MCARVRMRVRVLLGDISAVYEGTRLYITLFHKEATADPGEAYQQRCDTKRHATRRRLKNQLTNDNRAVVVRLAGLNSTDIELATPSLLV